MSDDHSSQAWGLYGGHLDSVAPTPHIQRLAREGCLLLNCFCTNSICVPSRATILTGQYSHRNHVYSLSDSLDPEADNVAKILKNAGYQTAIIGKWHLKTQPTGFDHFTVLPGQGRYHDPILKTRDDWEQGREYTGFSTVVIYTSDQGYFLGEHGFFDKRIMYEEALCMLFVIRNTRKSFWISSSGCNACERSWEIQTRISLGSRIY
jgi:hypothetical protein